METIINHSDIRPARGRRQQPVRFSPLERLHNGGALTIDETCALKNVSRSKFFLDRKAGLVETQGGRVLNPSARKYLGLD
ncbi:hypothetical protein WOC76_04270 [Methylocystis sp. IM3]|uniref:hypothetical protein n=1 Tax=Methylocystis sp. IM3 TaxID=3136722 RepID=UPI003119876C